MVEFVLYCICSSSRRPTTVNITNIKVVFEHFLFIDFTYIEFNSIDEKKIYQFIEINRLEKLL